MTDESRQRITVDAPELGASVELVECTVGDLLPLIAKASEGDNMELMLATLAATLHVDGKRVTRKEMEAWPARRLRALLRIGPQALAVNNFAQANESGEEGADEPKS